MGNLEIFDHLGNHTDTKLLAGGFMETPASRTAKIADGVALIERHDLQVAKVLLHPTIVHRVVASFRDILDVDATYKTVGTMWGAEVHVDAMAPRNGFTLKSGDDDLCVRYEGPEPPLRGLLEIPTIFCKSPVRLESILELLDLSGQWGAGDSLRLELSARVYVDIRKFGRDFLNITTMAADLRRGHMGDIYGVPVMVSKEVTTQIVLRDIHRVYGVLETDPNANPALKVMTDRVLAGNYPESYVDRIMAGMNRGIEAVWSEILYDLDDNHAEDAKRVLLRAVAKRLAEQYTA